MNKIESLGLLIACYELAHAACFAADVEFEGGALAEIAKVTQESGKPQ